MSYKTVARRLSSCLDILKLHIHGRGPRPGPLLLPLLLPLLPLLPLLAVCRRRKRLGRRPRRIRRRLPALLRQRQPNLAGLLLHCKVLPQLLLPLLLLLLLGRCGGRLRPLPRLDLEILAQQAVGNCKRGGWKDSWFANCGCKVDDVHDCLNVEVLAQQAVGNCRWWARWMVGKSEMQPAAAV